MIKEIKSAEIWLYNDLYYLRAYSVTVDGVRDSGGNPIHVIKAEELDQLAPTIMQTLTECKFNVPHPDFRIKVRNEMLDVTGAKTEKTLMTKGKSVSVYLAKDHLDMNAWYFNGKYLTSSKEKKMHCDLEPENIKATILSAFEKCHP
jgi:hypothetical protein